MRTQEKLIYTNERGESIEFSPASSYHVNFKDVTGLSDVRNAIYSTNSMGQDGDTYLGYRIESRDMLEAVLFNDITTNPFLILFDDLDGVTSTGIWNESLQRIEC